MKLLNGTKTRQKWLVLKVDNENAYDPVDPWRDGGIISSDHGLWASIVESCKKLHEKMYY